MSSLALDKHTFCFKCRGANCDSQNKCDECMSWSSGEMEAYVKLRKSLASKSRKPKSGSSKPPSSPMSVAPIAHDLSDVSSHMTGQFDSLKQSFDTRFEALSNFIFERFDNLARSMSDRMSASINLPSFSAEPRVLVQQPVHGQDTSLSSPDGTDGCHRLFQESGGDPMSRGSGFAHPSCIGESLARNINLGAAEALTWATPFGDAAHAQLRSFPLRRNVSFDNSTSPSSAHPEGELEDDDDRDSVASVDAVYDKTFARLIAFVYDQYPESRLLSSPLSLHGAVSRVCLRCQTRLVHLDPNSAFIHGYRRLFLKLGIAPLSLRLSPNSSTVFYRLNAECLRLLMSLIILARC